VKLDEEFVTRDTAGKLSVIAKDLQKRGRKSSTVIFVLDNFDLFASRPRQTLLYSLFNLAQEGLHSAVIGITRKARCLETLEKRVSSRSALSTVALRNYGASEMQLIAVQYLLLEQFEASQSTADAARVAGEWRSSVHQLDRSGAFAEFFQRLAEQTSSVTWVRALVHDAAQHAYHRWRQQCDAAVGARQATPALSVDMQHFVAALRDVMSTSNAPSWQST
jgi:hypothetical protein